MAIMLLAEEYENLFSNTEEYKGDCPLSNQFLIPAVALPVMPPVAVVLTFVEGRDLTGILHFNGAFIISLPIILYRGVRQNQLQYLAISSISRLPLVLLGGAFRQEIIQDISWLPNLLG